VCPGPFSLGAKAAARRGMMPNLRLAGSSLACNNTARFVRRPGQKVPGFDREQERLGNSWRFMENLRPSEAFSGIFER